MYKYKYYETGRISKLFFSSKKTLVLLLSLFNWVKPLLSIHEFSWIDYWHKSRRQTSAFALHLMKKCLSFWNRFCSFLLLMVCRGFLCICFLELALKIWLIDDLYLCLFQTSFGNKPLKTLYSPTWKFHMFDAIKGKTFFFLTLNKSLSVYMFLRNLNFFLIMQRWLFPILNMQHHNI